MVLKGPFAVSGDTFYIEYNFKLFRWEIGNAKWQGYWIGKKRLN